MKPERTIPEMCRGCGARIAWVYSVNRPKDYPNVPVDWDTLHAVVQNSIRQGHHVEFNKGMVSHFTTCAKREQFSKRKPAKPKPKEKPGDLAFEKEEPCQ